MFKFNSDFKFNLLDSAGLKIPAKGCPVSGKNIIFNLKWFVKLLKK